SEDPRVPSGAGGDRSTAPAASAGEGSGGGGAGGCAWDEAPGGLCDVARGCTPECRRTAGPYQGDITGVHGTKCLYGTGEAAADSDRQARPPIAACAGCHGVCESGVRGAAGRAGAACGADLAGTAPR